MRLIKLARRAASDVRWKLAGLLLPLRIKGALGSRDVTVVQVGSNDGIQGDPITRLIRSNPAWKALFIEPIPAIFRRLVGNYPDSPNYAFENVAITPTTGTRPLFYVSDEIKKVLPNIPYWYDQLGSFSEEHILKHGEHFRPFIRSENVVCEPLSNVLERNQINRIDLLHVDTEGYDYEVLNLVDFERFQPKVILFEHIHLSRNDCEAASKLLEARKYRIIRLRCDTLAILP